MSKTKTLSAHTAAVLASATVDGQTVRLNCDQLDRALYEPIGRVLDTLGGVWASGKRVHIFPPHTYPAALIADVVASGVEPIPARTLEGYVRTPDDLADRLASDMRDLYTLHDGALVLDPSAGDGALCRAVLETNTGVHIHAVEPSDVRAHALDVLAADYPGRVTVHRRTLEAFTADWEGPAFDAVIMNPPFAVPSNKTLWMDHVGAAYNLLTPGGHLVAIVPQSYAYRNDQKHQQFREWVADRRTATFTRLPGDAFKESGTTVSTGILSLARPIPGHRAALPLWLLGELPQGEPVPVNWVQVTRAVAAPVQAYRYSFDETRIVRFAGCCFGCARTIWVHDKPVQEPPFDWSACSVLDAEDVGKVGPSVLLCMTCVNDHPTYLRAVAAAATWWRDVPGAEPVGPTVYPMDLGKGLVVEVSGVSGHGHDDEVSTVIGRVDCDPEQVEHNGRLCVLVYVRTVESKLHRVHMDPQTRVCLFDAPVYEAAPGDTGIRPAAGARTDVDTHTDGEEVDEWAQLAFELALS